ncbi:uncharacterized protein LOC6637546, partial [Drosophila willistoni]|uniref:uncharacterized protein LOC6637546 n=1 Tax=Drosophila willistoni TaxID=7260 RepID=UPI001F086AEE
NIMVCDNFDVCETVEVPIDVSRTEIKNSEYSVINHLSYAVNFLEYADWEKAFIVLYQLTKGINSKERLLVFTETLSVYQPQTTVQLSQLVRLTKRVVLSLEPLDDMEVNVLARMLHLISSTFKLIISSNELNTLMNDYYDTMVSDLCDLLNKFNAEWEYIPKPQCRSESESCLNIDNFRSRIEQMSTLQPKGLEHINNWLHAHWKLSSCLFYMGMGAARRLHPEEDPTRIVRSTFIMRLESFDLDQERVIQFESPDKMHTLIFTEKLLQELRQRLRTDEVLISVRSHKQSQYWWYPEQESQTQVLVVNAYTTNAIWQKTQELTEPFQYISKLKINFSASEPDSARKQNRINRGIDFDDPEEDVENVIHDSVYSPDEIRMYRTELYGQSVLGVTFSQADIDFKVKLQMLNVPNLNYIDMDTEGCLIKTGVIDPNTLLLRNRCSKARPVFIFLRAANLSEAWDPFKDTGAFFAFSTEIRSCRIWNYARPEPSWQTFACLPEMNKSVHFGIHCQCRYISDFDADSMPIIAIPINLKCHLEIPLVGRNYNIIFLYAIITIITAIYLFLNKKTIFDWDKQLYVQQYQSTKLCNSGDIVVWLTFGGRYNAGTSANIIFFLNSNQAQTKIILYQDPVRKTFERNSTISFRIYHGLIQIPTSIKLFHDNSGIYPNFFCRSIIITDLISDRIQHFRIHRWIEGVTFQTQHKLRNISYCAETLPKELYTWYPRFKQALENYMGNWYLFQPIIGPWRFGMPPKAYCRYERSCIFITKLFVSMCIVVLYFGRTVSIACDPSPKKYNDIGIVIWLCFICFFASALLQELMELLLKLII